jgi:hypothetical protein
MDTRGGAHCPTTQRLLLYRNVVHWMDFAGQDKYTVCNEREQNGATSDGNAPLNCLLL